MNLYNLMDDMDEIAATQGAVIILASAHRPVFWACRSGR
tara:strand:+ start:453 stop:569 length:117 start_codon:yes stop_codon:yes gene_type:complete